MTQIERRNSYDLLHYGTELNTRILIQKSACASKLDEFTEIHAGVQLADRIWSVFFFLDTPGVSLPLWISFCSDTHRSYS